MQQEAGGSRLQMLVGVVLLALIGNLVLTLIVSLIAHSRSWDLPKGPLLDQALSSCQFVHTTRDDFVSEHMLCPTRLKKAHDFPQVLRDAVVASEDERFFYHGAIDLISTFRAVWHLFVGERQGGSTITQQLARSILLKKEDSFERKLLEAVLAIRIQARLSREELLTRYLNVAPQARNMYGFDDPARYYFGVKARDLDLAEAALLVGMLPEPNNRDPLKNPPAALSGALGVLAHMVEQRKITADDAESAEEELRIRLRSGKLRRGREVYTRLEYRPYRDLAIREARASGIALGDDYRLIVHFDAAFQRVLLSKVCALSGAHQAAGVFMRPSGEVLALAGSCDYTGEWNRVTDIARSIGSTGKLFPLIGVHEAGISLAQRASTRPIRRPNWPGEANARCLTWRAVTLNYALAQSCNRPWTDISMRLGRRVTDIVARFGITPPAAPSLVPIGGVYTSPLKLTQAYAAIKNNGVLPQVQFLIAAIGPKGNILGLPRRVEERRVMSSATARAVLQDLRGPVRRGTGHLANSVHALVYGKTGTSSRNMDALFVGLTEDYVGSFWLGYDRPRPMPGIVGGGTPAKAFSELTDYYYVKLAQNRYIESRHEFTDPLKRWKRLADETQFMKVAAVFGTILLTYMAVGNLRRRRRSVVASSNFVTSVPQVPAPLFEAGQGAPER